GIYFLFLSPISTNTKFKLFPYTTLFRSKYDLVIIDELGYISFDKDGAELLFSHLSLRAGRKSTIITSNLSFLKWQEIFHDPVLTAALTDRLTHKHVVNMRGPSFRMKETEKWMKMNEDKVAHN